METIEERRARQLERRKALRRQLVKERLRVSRLRLLIFRTNLKTARKLVAAYLIRGLMPPR